MCNCYYLIFHEIKNRQLNPLVQSDDSVTFLSMLFLWVIFYSLVNYRRLTEDGGNSTVDPPESHHVPTFLGVILTMTIGTLLIFLAITPLCCMKQEEEFKYDPSKPLLGNAPVD